MNRAGIILVSLGFVACSRLNPLYGDLGTGQAEGSGESSSGPLPGTDTTTSMAADGSGSGETSTGPSTGSFDTGKPEEKRCDLYAINAQGALYVIDVDEPSASQVAGPSSMYASMALATHPDTGVLHFTLVGDFEFIWTIDPDPIAFPDVGWEGFARATFDDETLWLGTLNTGRFGAFVPGDQDLEDFQIAMVETGGDMVRLTEDAALVVTETGRAIYVNFNGTVDIPLTIEGLMMNMNMNTSFTGLAIDNDERIWMSTGGPSSDLLQIALEHKAGGMPTIVVVDTIPTEIPIDDLAPIAAPFDEC